jgi:hypothetical protein
LRCSWDESGGEAAALGRLLLRATLGGCGDAGTRGNWRLGIAAVGAWQQIACPAPRLMALRVAHATRRAGVCKRQSTPAALGKAKLSCPDGYTLQQDKLGLNQCVKQTPQDCPKGTTLNEETGKCCPPET